MKPKIPVRKVKSGDADGRQTVECLVYPTRGEQVTVGDQLFDQDGNAWELLSIAPFEFEPVAADKRVKKPKAVAERDEMLRKRQERAVAERGASVAPPAGKPLRHVDLLQLPPLRGAHRAKFVGDGELARGAWLWRVKAEIPKAELASPAFAPPA